MADESATPDLVELWQEANKSFNERDLDAAVRFYAPDAVLDATRTIGSALRGRVEIRSSYEDWFAAYEELKVALEEPFDLGNGVAFGIARQEGRLHGSTRYVQQREGVITLWAEGLVTNQVFYQDIDEARAVAERLVQERG
jgi:ketosteroid isomerase-like protein